MLGKAATKSESSYVSFIKFGENLTFPVHQQYRTSFFLLVWTVLKEKSMSGYGLA